MSIDNAVPGGAESAGTIIVYRRTHASGTIPTDVYELSVPGYGELIPGTLRVRTDALTSTMLLAGLFAEFLATCSAVNAFSDLSKTRAVIRWKGVTAHYQHFFYTLGSDPGLCAVELDGQVIDPEGRWDFQRPKDIPVLDLAQLPTNERLVAPYWPTHCPPQGWRETENAEGADAFTAAP